eukprot:NODE_59_length_28102_cov_0.971110.p4 type:complete len:650 gc:universal NODE_59_length_28102_cov_0.971110:23581-25530(+)
MELLTELECLLGKAKPLKIDGDKACALKKSKSYPTLEEIYIFLTKAVLHKTPICTKDWQLLLEQISYLRAFQKLEVLKLQGNSGLRQIKKSVTSRSLTTMDMIHNEVKHSVKDRRYHLRWKKWMCMMCIRESINHPLALKIRKIPAENDAMDIDNELEKEKLIISELCNQKFDTTYDADTTDPVIYIKTLGEENPITLNKPTYDDVFEELNFTPLPYMLDRKEIKKKGYELIPIEFADHELFVDFEDLTPVEDVETTNEWFMEEDDFLLEILESLHYSHKLSIKNSCWRLVTDIHNLHFRRPSDFMGKLRSFKEIQKRYFILSEQRPLTSSMKLRDSVDKMFNTIAMFASKKPKPINPTKKQPFAIDKSDVQNQTPQEVEASRFSENPEENGQSGSNQFYQYLNRPMTQQQVQKRTGNQNSSYSNQPNLQNKTAVEQWQSFLAQRQYLQSYGGQRKSEEDDDKKKKRRKSSTVTLKQQQQPDTQSEDKTPHPLQNQVMYATNPSAQVQMMPMNIQQQQQYMQMAAQMSVPQNINQIQMAQQQQQAMQNQQIPSNYNSAQAMQWMAHVQRQKYRQQQQFPSSGAVQRPNGMDLQHQAAVYSYQQRPPFYGQQVQFTPQQMAQLQQQQQQIQQQAAPPAQKPKKRKKKKDD